MIITITSAVMLGYGIVLSYVGMKEESKYHILIIGNIWLVGSIIVGFMK